MFDPLHARAMAAIEQSRKLQAEKDRLRREYFEHLEALRVSILESARLRVGVKAHRDDKQ